MEQSFCEKLSSHSANQKLSCLLWSLNVCCSFHFVIIIIIPLSGQAALLPFTDCEHLEEQESGRHPRVDVSLDRRSWLGQPICKTCCLATTEELG